MAKKNLAQLLIEIEENCEMKTHAGVYMRLLEKCFKKNIFSRHRKNQKTDFVISPTNNLWSTINEKWKTVDAETLRRLKFVAAKEKKVYRWNLLQKKVAIKKAMKWSSKEAKQTKTKFVPPSTSVVNLPPSDPNFWLRIAQMKTPDSQHTNHHQALADWEKNKMATHYGEMLLKCLYELSSDESSGGEITDDEDIQKIVDDVVASVHAKFLNKKKKNQKKKKKKRKKRTSGVNVKQISEDRIHQQMENFSDLLRDKDDDRIIVHYQECTVNHLFVRPSSEQYRIPLLKELITKRMKTLSIEEPPLTEKCTEMENSFSENEQAEMIQNDVIETEQPPKKKKKKNKKGDDEVPETFRKNGLSEIRCFVVVKKLTQDDLDKFGCKGSLTQKNSSSVHAEPILEEIEFELKVAEKFNSELADEVGSIQNHVDVRVSKKNKKIKKDVIETLETIVQEDKTIQDAQVNEGRTKESHTFIGGGSSSSSYSSLSDLVSEQRTPDASPGPALQAVPMTLSSGLDLKSIYRPPSTLQLPGGGSGLEMQESAFSQPESMSSSSSQSSIGSSHGIQTELAAESDINVTKPRNISEDKTDDVFNASDSETVVPIDQADVGASVTVDHSLEFPVSTDGSQLPQRITNTKVWMNAASSLRKPFVEKKFKPVKPRKQ